MAKGPRAVKAAGLQDRNGGSTENPGKRTLWAPGSQYLLVSGSFFRPDCVFLTFSSQIIPGILIRRFPPFLLSLTQVDSCYL